MSRDRQTARRWPPNSMLLAALVVAGCAVSRPGAMAPEPATNTRPSVQPRTLVALFGKEPASVATRAFVSQGTSLASTFRVFNGLLTLGDARGELQPELLASLPALNTDSWQVFADGTMQTTYTLRSNLTWHDGEPLTADDFVFAWRVYSYPELGTDKQPPMGAIAEVAATDRAHFRISWKSPYPDADNLSTQPNKAFPPLPQHILGPAFEQMPVNGRETFAGHPFWGPQFVGLGPYRLDRWEAGSFISGVRFEGYALGAPKIERIELRVSADPNAAMASLLASEAHIATSDSIGHAPDALAEQWAHTGAGTILQWPNAWRGAGFQLRTDLTNPRALLDPRVRKAIAHAVDKQAMSDGLYEGHGIFADTPVWRGSGWGKAIDDSITTYPLDLRAAESLLNQAGFRKGSDGFYTGADGRLSPEIMTVGDPDSVRELVVLSDGLRAAGLDVQPRAIGAHLSQAGEIRATFPGMQLTGTTMGETVLLGLASSQIPTPANRWQGFNRGGWSSPEYDRLATAFSTTLDRRERVGLVRQMLRVYVADLPWVSLFYRASAFAYVAELKGPAETSPESNVLWNIHQWEFR